MTFKVVPDGTIDWSPEKKSLFYGIIKVESGLLRADSDVRKGKRKDDKTKSVDMETQTLCIGF